MKRRGLSPLILCAIGQPMGPMLSRYSHGTASPRRNSNKSFPPWRWMSITTFRSMRYVFIGGQSDGQKLEVPDQAPSLRVKSSPLGYGVGATDQQTYTRRRMATSHGDITFYAHESLTVYATMLKLLEGYKP